MGCTVLDKHVCVYTNPSLKGLSDNCSLGTKDNDSYKLPMMGQCHLAPFIFLSRASQGLHKDYFISLAYDGII